MKYWVSLKISLQKYECKIVTIKILKRIDRALSNYLPSKLVCIFLDQHNKKYSKEHIVQQYFMWLYEINDHELSNK